MGVWKGKEREGSKEKKPKNNSKRFLFFSLFLLIFIFMFLNNFITLLLQYFNFRYYLLTPYYEKREYTFLFLPAFLPSTHSVHIHIYTPASPQCVSHCIQVYFSATCTCLFFTVVPHIYASFYTFLFFTEPIFASFFVCIVF